MNESPQTLPPAPYDDEIDLRELFRVLWAGKWLVVGITLAAAVIAVIVALMLPNIYRAEALLAPNHQEGAGGLSASAAQYGRLASLAGINLGSGKWEKTALGLETLKSRKFISEFIDRRDILVPLMAVDGWDPKSNELNIDSDVYDVAADKWVREVSFPKKKIPSLQEGYKKFMENFVASQDIKSGFVTISVEHYSPAVAKQWVDWLVEDINATIMKQDVAEAEQAIEYLKKQIDATSLSDLQSVFFGLIEEQTKTVMLAEVSNEYLLKTIDPAVASETKSKPNRAMIVVVSAFSSALFSLLLIVLVGPRGRSRQ